MEPCKVKTITIAIACLLSVTAMGQQIYSNSKSTVVGNKENLPLLSLQYTNAFVSENDRGYRCKSSSGLSDDGTDTFISTINTNYAWQCAMKWIDSITVTDMTDSMVIMCRLFRDADNAADSVSGDANLIGFDFHYQVDSLGSETP